jgi:hypothetical protein
MGAFPSLPNVNSKVEDDDTHFAIKKERTFLWVLSYLVRHGSVVIEY